MSKPWDKLRKPVEPKKPPIGVGEWKTDEPCPIVVGVISLDNKTSFSTGYAELTFKMMVNPNATAKFLPSEMRLISEFLLELADQLEGK